MARSRFNVEQLAMPATEGNALMFPALFLSHGSPMLVLTDCPARDFLAGLGRTLGRPRAILVASAHWETAEPTLNAVSGNATIHDFYGFPRPLYELAYPAPGSPALAEDASALLRAAGLPGRIDHARGLDHGAWAPLLLMYPEADIPVLQVSVQTALGTAHHLRLGQALAPLREREVLVIGSGSFTHDLRRIRPGAPDAPEPPDVTQFAAWFDDAITGGRVADLLAYRRLAPGAVANHPTEEHLLPLYVAMGAGGTASRGEALYRGGMYGVLRMDAYAFA
jgi:4,5-DOPA dioxygenase extradiol